MAGRHVACAEEGDAPAFYLDDQRCLSGFDVGARAEMAQPRAGEKIERRE